MFAAILTTILWSISVVCAHRSAKMIGGSEANFWRLSVATFFLAIWAYGFGEKMEGDSFPVFLWSGIIGIGLGDVALFQALPRLGSRMTILIIQCLSAPFAALIEWRWLGTKLTGIQMFFGAIVLGGVLLALAPSKHLQLSRRQIVIGTLFGIFAALGNAIGAVLTRKGYALATAAHQHIDGGTSAFQRIIGGLFVAGIWLLIVKQQTRTSPRFSSPREKWRKVWPWVLANGFAGQTLGVTCYQIALKHAPTGIVMPIIATTPLVVIPFAHFMEAEKPTVKSIIGSAIAVCGVIGLVLAK
ncbi:MAG: DMT family transporter [Verrucomicrobiota bacterium]